MNVIVQISLLIFAVIIGGLVVEFVSAKQKKQTIKLSLAFGGGFLLAISFVHFLPELYAQHAEKIGIYILIGFLIQLFLEYFSGGIEHGHVHHHHDKKFPWVLFISLSVHSVLEGIPLMNGEIGHHHHHESVNSLLVGILIHQVPVAIALMSLFKEAKYSRSHSWLFLLLFAIMTPAGLVIGYVSGGYFPLKELNSILAIVIGMLLHISTTIIFETSEHHKFNMLKLSSILAGVLLAMFVH